MTRYGLIFVLVGGLAFGAAAELRAGTARAEVTPPVGGPMYGYGARGTNVSQAVHDPLYAKALVLDDGETRLAIVNLDMGSVERKSTARVQELTAKAQVDKILLVASHTHSAPRASDDFPSEAAPWIREAEAKIAGAIVEAAANLRPAEIGAGWGQVEEGHNRRKVLEDGTVEMLWVNRERVPTSPVDYALGVLHVRESGGETIATLINYQTHPVVLGPENLAISADYPGYMMNKVEAELGGQAMFLQGAAGDINPFWDKTPPEEGGFEEAEKMGLAVGAEAVRTVKGIAEYVDDADIKVHTETIALSERRDRARETREIEAEINAVLIGDEIALATFPGEFFVEHGLTLKERSRFPHTFFIGYTNDALAYFPTIQATTEGGYGAESATRVEVGAGEHLVNRALINLYYLAEMIRP